MTKFVKVASNYAVNAAAIKAVKAYDALDFLRTDSDVPAGAIVYSENRVEIPTPDGDKELVFVEYTLTLQLTATTFKSETVVDDVPVGAVVVEMMDGNVHLMPMHKADNDLAKILLKELGLDL